MCSPFHMLIFNKRLRLISAPPTGNGPRLPLVSPRHADWRCWKTSAPPGIRLGELERGSHWSRGFRQNGESLCPGRAEARAGQVLDLQKLGELVCRLPAGPQARPGDPVRTRKNAVTSRRCDSPMHPLPITRADGNQ